MATSHYLLAVLDWGLGHASRCVPLVQGWQAEGKQVTIASSGAALTLLKTTFPTANFLDLPTYGIRYPGENMVWNMAIQSPRVARVIWQEHQLIKKFIRTTSVDHIVSDGRFGCHHPQVASVWLAHQLQIQHPQPWLARSANWAYHLYLRRYFQSIWVPDWSDSNSLAGQLSMPVAQLPHQYLGPLSRFANSALEAHAAEKFPYLALLSGPEPQRSHLEAEIKTLFLKTGVRGLIVRGVPGSTAIQYHNDGLATVDWLLGDALHRQVMAAELLICRSGYSTLMDLHYWQKPALLIPTPGQTEQVYLAHYWAAQGWATWQSQGAVSLT